jgi:hypothetical protein
MTSARAGSSPSLHPVTVIKKSWLIKTLRLTSGYINLPELALISKKSQPSGENQSNPYQG